MCFTGLGLPGTFRSYVTMSIKTGEKNDGGNRFRLLSGRLEIFKAKFWQLNCIGDSLCGSWDLGMGPSILNSSRQGLTVQERNPPVGMLNVAFPRWPIWNCTRPPERPPLTAPEGAEIFFWDRNVARSLPKAKIRPKLRDIYYFGPYLVTIHRAHTLDSVATGCGVGGVCMLVAT
jgi:hypothetical protein